MLAWPGAAPVRLTTTRRVPFVFTIWRTRAEAPVPAGMRRVRHVRCGIRRRRPLRTAHMLDHRMTRKVTVSIDGYGVVKIKHPRKYTPGTYADGVATAVAKTMQLAAAPSPRFHPAIGFR